MHLPYPQQLLNRPIFTTNQALISSCTHRLIQIQNQLQAKQLKQQLISSLVMKQVSLKKLLQQQDLLIMYLKEQVRDLNMRQSEYFQMERRLVHLEKKYMALAEWKKVGLVQNEEQLIGLKVQYNDLHTLLNKLTAQSSTLYQLKLKLSQRNAITKQLLTQKITEYCQIKQQHKSQTKIKQQKISQNKQSHQQAQTIKQQNINLNKEFNQKATELESNKLKLISLQQAVEQLQGNKLRLKEIQKAAQKDNLVLKQSLKEKIQLMKDKQHHLKQLNKEKELLQNQKNTQTEKVNSLVKENQSTKNNLNDQINLGNQLKTHYQSIVKDRFQQQVQFQKLQHQTSALRTTNQASLRLCLQTQQNLQRNIYFIDQYLLLNSQLITQMQVLLQQQINKSTIASHFSRTLKDRTSQVHHLKQFLSRIQYQMIQTQRSIQSLVKDFDSYRIQ